MNAGKVVEWLRSPEGEQWSACRHQGRDTMPWDQPPTAWRATGPLDAGHDPCGSAPLLASAGGSR